MPVKTSVKKTTKNAQQTKGLKPVKKTPKKVTLDDLLKAQEEAWAAIREAQQAQKEVQQAHKETEASFKKFQDETRKAQKETEKVRDEAWKAIRETQKNIGGLNNSLGSIVEHLLIPGLPKKFEEFGFNFHRIATYRYTDGVYAQIDGMP